VNTTTVFVSNSGWAPPGEDMISSEEVIARNAKPLGAGEISILKKNAIVPIGRKKRAEFGTTR